MAVVWEYRGPLLVVTETGVSENDELERALIGEALHDPRARLGLSILWDARGSLTPLTAEDVEWRRDTLSRLADAGRLSRFALLGRAEQQMSAHIARGMNVPGLSFNAFTDEAEAIAWLAR